MAQKNIRKGLSQLTRGRIKKLAKTNFERLAGNMALEGHKPADGTLARLLA